jgi:hypothetical protein
MASAAAGVQQQQPHPPGAPGAPQPHYPGPRAPPPVQAGPYIGGGAGGRPPPPGGPQQMYRQAGPPQGMGVPPNKRIKVEEEDEEDPVLPRELAAQRFVRWTEWMEEILSSGYNIRTYPQFIPRSFLVIVCQGLRLFLLGVRGGLTRGQGDIVPPQGPTMNLREEDLRTRIAILESDLRTSKSRHDDLITKFKSSCQIWKEGTRKLALTTPSPHQFSHSEPSAAGGDVPRLDGIAGTAKDAETSVSSEIQARAGRLSPLQIEEINAEVLRKSGISNPRIRVVKTFRSVGKHIEFEPVKRVAAKPPPAPMVATVMQTSPPKEVSEPGSQQQEEGEGVLSETAEEGVVGEDVVVGEDGMEEEELVDGHANEAFEAMEAMDFDASADFDFDEENQVGNEDLTMDIGED